MKSKILSLYAAHHARQTSLEAQHAIQDQQKIFNYLIKKGKSTRFGKDHHFEKIATYTDFRKRIPVREYEQLSAYIDQIRNGEINILWQGRPKYWAKTSGTTSGAKYIPISHESIKSHIATASRAVFNFVHQQKATLFDGKLMFLSGSPALSHQNKISSGRLSGIVNHEIPNWLQGNQIPDFKTNCINDWNDKLAAIVELSSTKDLRLISGIPPWVQMYFEMLLAYTGKKTILEVFPNLELFVHGGVNYKPYAASIEKLIGGPLPVVETYPASEGFIAYQNDWQEEGLLLNTKAGMFYEFIPLEEYFKDNPPRLTLEEIELNQDYALIISSTAGLWAYSIGDTVRFVSKDPYKLMVSGRVKHFISAFGEHVIAKEIEEAMTLSCQALGISISEFTVAPQVNPAEGLPYHEWLIEVNSPLNKEQLATRINKEMVRQNIYYADLIRDEILSPCRLTLLSRGCFQRYMGSIGKLGGQNKVPRLSNDRTLAEALLRFN